MSTQNGISSNQLADEPGSSDNPSQVKQRRVPQFRSTGGSSPAAADRPSPAPPMHRKPSNTFSFRTNSSSPDPRFFDLRTSTGDLLSPRALNEHGDVLQETSIWHSVPLFLAMLPAIGGLAFKSGSVFMTDLVLLLLAAIYLNWFLVTPWTWYHSARSIYLINPSTHEVAVEDPLEDSEEEKDDNTAGKHVPEKQKDARSNNSRTMSPVQELQVHELLALLLCFLGPLLGSYVLHVIRGSLSQLGDQLISNLHLTLFVLGAEIRPLRHAMKLVHARTLYLQRIVQEDPQSVEKVPVDVVKELSKRLDEIEASTADMTATPVPELPTAPAPDNSEQFKKAHSALQTQIDALNRAVRRYEKRSTAETMQTEARLQDLETRLREALSLAAVAAAYSQKPGIVVSMLEGMIAVLLVPVKLANATVMLPLKLLNDFTTAAMEKFGLLSSETRGTSSAKQRAFAKSARNSTFVQRYKS